MRWFSSGVELQNVLFIDRISWLGWSFKGAMEATNTFLLKCIMLFKLRARLEVLWKFPIPTSSEAPGFADPWMRGFEGDGGDVSGLAGLSSSFVY